MLGILMNVVRQAATPTLSRLFVNAATSAAGAALGGAVVGGAVYAAKRVCQPQQRTWSGQCPHCGTGLAATLPTSGSQSINCCKCGRSFFA